MVGPGGILKIDGVTMWGSKGLHNISDYLRVSEKMQRGCIESECNGSTLNELKRILRCLDGVIAPCDPRDPQSFHVRPVQL